MIYLQSFRFYCFIVLKFRIIVVILDKSIFIDVMFPFMIYNVPFKIVSEMDVKENHPFRSTSFLRQFFNEILKLNFCIKTVIISCMIF